MTTPSVVPPSEDPADVLPKEGTILAGKYRIEKVLGQGGMGMVVAAQHTLLRDRVAIKFLLPEAAKREDATERFRREAMAARSIQSEHVARIMEVDILETGSPYMVMELLTGCDLGVLLAERGAFPIGEAVDYVLQACEAIAEAHAIGIIHRDLKPANLFLTRRVGGAPFIKVLDFGLSKVTKPDALDASLTAANVVMGSPCYMSPEQIRSLKGLDARTDIWALGVILYQILTGVRPFEAPSLGALFFTIGADPPLPLRQRRPDIPAELEAAVLQCLEKDPTRRTQTIAELARALSPFGSDEARVSVERIHQVLSDRTPFPARRGSISDGTSDAVALQRAALQAVNDNDPTVAQPYHGGGTAPHTPGGPSAPPVNYVFNPPSVAPSPFTMGEPPKPPPPLTAQAVSAAGIADQQVKSGSMAAIAKDDMRPSTPPRAARSRRGLVAGVVGGAMATTVAAMTIALVMMGRNQGAPVPTMAMQAGMPPSSEPSVAVTPAATVSAVPSTGAEEAPSSAPSAVPSTSASATAKPHVPKPAHSAVSPGNTKKSKDILDKWK